MRLLDIRYGFGEAAAWLTRFGEARSEFEEDSCSLKYSKQHHDRPVKQQKGE